MSKQDRQGVRKASDLERKYDFSLIAGKGSSSASEKLNNLTQSFAQFVAATNGRLEELESNATTWFYSGTPSLDNHPAVGWESDEVRDTHVGDMYYDEDTTCTYLFKRTETEEEVKYEWVPMFKNVLPSGITVTFYDASEEVIAFYSVKEGTAVNPPKEATWKDGSGNTITFPYTPTENVELYEEGTL